jgi:hypothetical protein
MFEEGSLTTVAVVEAGVGGEVDPHPHTNVQLRKLQRLLGGRVGVRVSIDDLSFASVAGYTIASDGDVTVKLTESPPEVIL